MVDLLVREAAFAWLAEQVALHGDVLEWSLLSRGFDCAGRRVPLVSQQGIFKPALCELPLSIRTSPGSPYKDRLVADHFIYSYRGTDRTHRDNQGLLELMRTRTPLIYFLGVEEGRYLATWPVLVVGDDPSQLEFRIQAEPDAAVLGGASATAALVGASPLADDPRRSYATRLVYQRLHQRRFRERVLDAYRSQCSMCRLRRRAFLDAAHIKPDILGGEPVVPNGLALCKIHHTAFDIGVLGVRPDTLRIKVRADVLEEIDGPMLRHGLQGLDQQPIWTPRDPAKRPDAAMLEWKWNWFERAG
jgi:putative restriction endonuclease